MAQSHQFAGIGIRVVAALIDFILIGIVSGVIIVSLGVSGGSIGIANVVIAPIALGYFILLEAYNDGQTVGKMVTNIKVTTDVGGDLTIGGSAIRNVLRVVDALPFLYIIGLVLIAVTDDKQRVGDIAAKTIVVKA